MNPFKQIIPAIKIRHIERMADDSEFEVVENKQKKWTSTYAHQKRPDTSERLKHVIPKDKLVVKRGRLFTTDTSQKQLTKEIDDQDERKAPHKNKVQQLAIHEPVTIKAKFACKNA